MSPLKQYNKIMVKLSGETLGGEHGVGLGKATIRRICREIASVTAKGKTLAVVMGAGNFIRGAQEVAEGMERVVADQIGMISTVVNALALREGLKELGVASEVLSAIRVGRIVEEYSPSRGEELLEKGVVVLCAGGTGNPFFTTDTAAVLRALELGCEAVFKATKVDGVYDKDPMKYPDAVRFEKITYDEIIAKKLKVMDLTAVALASEENIPLVVFNLGREGMLARVAEGDYSEATVVGYERFA